MTALVSLAEQSHSLLLVLLVVLDLVGLPRGGLFQELVAAHQDLLHVLGGHGEIRVVGGRSELVASHHEEDQSRELLEHRVEPLVLITE